MAVAAVPGAAPALRAGRRIRRGRGGGLLPVRQRDRDLVRQALRRHRVGAERDVPGAGVDPAGDVARRRVVRADEELGARAARPAAEALAAQCRAALVEEADVQRVARGAGRDRRLLVGVRDVDLPHPARDLQREVDEVRRTGGQGAGHRRVSVRSAASEPLAKVTLPNAFRLPPPSRTARVCRCRRSFRCRARPRTCCCPQGVVSDMGGARWHDPPW